jgi:7-cyano-7-deazaguanine synthase
MTNPKRAIVAVSGGPDSATTLWHCASYFDKVIAVTFHYGAVADKEVQVAKKLVKMANEKFGNKIIHKIVDISVIGAELKSSILSGSEVPVGNYEDNVEEAETTIVPFRNGIMLSILAGIAESYDFGVVAYGAHFNDGWLYPDCREEFVDAMRAAIVQGTGDKVTLLAPYTSCTKAAVLAEGDEMGVPLSETWSCYKGEGDHCGQCGSCIERQKAFKKAEVQDNTVYAEPWSGLADYEP